MNKEEFLEAVRKNVGVRCPICGCDFVTSSDAEKTQCPNCDFEFEIKD